MPENGEAVENRKADGSPRQLSRPESERIDRGERGEGRAGQSNAVRASGLFGFVQFFMDRPDVSSQSSGASSPSQSLPAPVSTSPIQVSASDSAAGRSPQSNSNFSPSPDAEVVVKTEVFSDGSKSDKSDVLQSESVLELQRSSTNLKSEEYRQLFHLPPEEVLVEDFNCALQKKILLQGHMYLFERYVCFYSNIFGYEKKKVIPLKDVTCVRKAKTAGVFPNAIEITSWGKKHFFASFLSRDEAHRLIINGWCIHSGYARMFLGSHYSSTSSPPSQGGVSLDSAAMSSTWRSPQRQVNLSARTGGTRNVEEDAKLESSTVEERGGLEQQANEDTSTRGLPNELIGINESSSVSTSSVSPMWEPEDVDAPGIPEGYKTVVESEFSVDVEEFFRLFFSDDAVGFNKNFHVKCGDDEFQSTQWAKHRHFGHARDISFWHPINVLFGPKSAYCHESQRFRVYRNSHLVLETTQQMTDIPYADYFRVEVRWDVERLCENGSHHCYVRVSVGVAFSKKTIWKGRIEQGTNDESKIVYTTWIREAHAMLQDIRSMAVEAGTVENPPSAPSSETEQNVIGMTNGHETILSEVEQKPLRLQADEPKRIPEEHRRIPDVECTVKHVTGAEEAQALNFTSDLHGIQWMKKGPAVLGSILLTSRKIWDRGSSIDLKANKQVKLFCFVLMAVIIVLTQVGIMFALLRTPKVQYVPVGYPSAQRTSALCFGGPSGDDAFDWLEQRARHLKEEIMMAEARLQTLHQDMAVLRMHSTHLISYFDNRFNSQQHSSSD